MDPFEVRMQFLSLLRRLNASQQSIQKVVAYALKYFSRCGEDLWDCVVEECQKGSINARINILYLLDSLCETSLLSKANSGSASSFYVDFVARDLATIVDYVVPEGREGLINLMSAVQILENWRNKRVLDPQKVEDVLAKLDVQKAVMHAAVSASSSKPPDAPDASNTAAGSGGGGESATFSRNEIFQRIEEDRERHKRLRERRWVQPVSLVHSQPLLASFAPAPDSAFATTTASAPIPSSSTATNTSTASASVNANASTNPNTTTNTASSTGLTLDIEFDNEWETTSDWNEDDEEAVAEENALCYPNAAKRLAPPPVSVSGSRSSIPEPFASVSGRDFERDTGRSYDLQKRGPVSDTSQFSKSMREPNVSTAIRTSNAAPTLISTATVQPKAASKRVRIDRTRMYERRET